MTKYIFNISKLVHMFNRCYRTLFTMGHGSLTDSFNQMILLKVRLPRIIEALLTEHINTSRSDVSDCFK